VFRLPGHQQPKKLGIGLAGVEDSKEAAAGHHRDPI
jgi:hypothetical protein